MAANNAAYYYHFDGLGSVVALSNSDGDSCQSYEYSAYGQVAASDPNFLTNPYMFTGRRFDIETGLYYYRARYYNPHIGRFMQTDPVGYDDGINWYLYCANNPLAFVDPSGTLMYPVPWDINDVCDVVPDVCDVLPDFCDVTVSDPAARGARSLWDAFKPDPGFRYRFKKSFYRNRLPGASAFSIWPVPAGPAIYYGSDLATKAVEKAAFKRHLRNMKSYSKRKDFVYFSGGRPGALKFVRGLGKALKVTTVFYTFHDIGNAIGSALAVWKEDEVIIIPFGPPRPYPNPHQLPPKPWF